MYCFLLFPAHTSLPHPAVLEDLGFVLLKFIFLLLICNNLTRFFCLFLGVGWEKILFMAVIVTVMRWTNLLWVTLNITINISINNYKIASTGNLLLLCCWGIITFRVVTQNVFSCKIIYYIIFNFLTHLLIRQYMSMSDIFDSFLIIGKINVSIVQLLEQINPKNTWQLDAIS